MSDRMYILDTDVVSNFRKRTPNANLLAWIAGIEAKAIGIPLAVISDIQMGIEKLRVLGKTLQADETEAWLESILHANQDGDRPGHRRNGHHPRGNGRHLQHQ